MLEERLKTARNSAGISQKALADKLFISQQAYAKYERGTSTPNPDTLKKISEILNVKVDYLLGNTSSMTPDPSLPAGAIPFTDEPTVKIPLVGVVSCGVPLLAEENIEAYIETRASDIVSGEQYFWLRAKGDSMKNVGIFDGDLLLIRSQSDVDSGEIAVVSVNGDHATLKRLIKKDNMIILQPENPDFNTLYFVGEEINLISVWGRLMKVEKKF